MKTALCLAGIGEILMDRFEDGEVTMGGAPFNLTFQLHQLLMLSGYGEAVMVSRVGSDAWGQHILKRIQDARMSAEFVQIDPVRATGSANVFAHNGGAGFEIVPHVAWDAIERTDALQQLARRCDAVVFGSLAQRSEPSRETIQSFVAQVNGPRLYDVNLRRNTTDGVAGYSVEIIERCLELATILKMNDTELEEVASMLAVKNDLSPGEERIWSLVAALCGKYKLDMVAITRGERGALLMRGGERLRLADSSLPQDQVHPVGAGDAFSAGLLFGVVAGWDLSRCSELAETLSSWVVTHTSATPVFTPEIAERIQGILAKTQAELLAGAR